MTASADNQCCWAIVPAAGGGRRFSADKKRPKQYATLLGQSVLAHSIQALLNISDKMTVLVALAEDDDLWLKEPLASNPRVETVVGGAHRSASVLSGLLALDGRAQADDFVLVHDAARPCVSKQDIRSLLDKTVDHPAGGLLACAVVDTLKQVDGNMAVQATINRDTVFRAQTPQVFRYGLLRRALEASESANEVSTDESAAVEKLGIAPLIVVGDASNIKITYASDLQQAETCLRARE